MKNKQTNSHITFLAVAAHRAVRDRVSLLPFRGDRTCMQEVPGWALHLKIRNFGNPKDWTPVYFGPGNKPATITERAKENYIEKSVPLLEETALNF